MCALTTYTTARPVTAMLKRLKRIVLVLLALPCLLAFFLGGRSLLAESADLGSYSQERDAEKYLNLPFSGANFICNSRLGHGAGRYYLRGKAAAAVLAAYAELESAHPEFSYMYGEMGWKGGGRFKPHRTHQNGLSADFMTPVYKLDAKGGRVAALLPASALNLWAYEIRLDGNGAFEDYRLNAEAMIAHLAALHAAAGRHGLRVERVIFDPPLLKILRSSPGFFRLKSLNFMENQAWFPHDGHYHVDFAEK